MCGPSTSSGRPYLPWSAYQSRVEIGQGLEAFRWLPDVYLFIKDRDRRFLYFSPNFPEMMGRAPEQLLGLRDEDISPEYLVDHYRSDDNAVLTSGIELTDFPELVHNERGRHDWNLTSKWPIYDRSGEIVAVGGVTRQLTKRSEVAERYSVLAPAIELMLTDLSRMVPLRELATSVALSPSQFGRAFRARFGMTPQQYQRRLRVEAACDLLATTDVSIAKVASECGYYDQSHMSNEFRAYKSMPPGAYRARFAFRSEQSAE